MDINIHSTQLAGLEVSWAWNYTEAQLRGLVVVAALFNKHIYVDDTQLGDNPHILEAYRLKRDRMSNLYTLLRDLIRVDVLRVALRDGMYLAQQDEFYKCDSLIDVYHAWHHQSMSSAWVVPPSQKHRESLLTDLDKELLPQTLARYDYITLKQDFMQRVRHAFQSRRGCFSNYFKSLPQPMQLQYEEILKRDWFSYSDIYALLNKWHLTSDNPFIQVHGLYSEESYAAWHGARLIGSDTPTWQAENDVISRISGRPVPQLGMSLDDATAEPIVTIDSPGLELIGTLNAEEIIRLREDARDLFLMVDLMKDQLDEALLHQLRDNYVEAISRYWDRICHYLRKSRPNLSHRRTKIGVFAYDHLPIIPHWAQRYSSFFFDIGLDLLDNLVFKLQNISPDLHDRILDLLSLRFLFYGDNEAMSQLRHAIPKHSWLSHRQTDLEET